MSNGTPSPLVIPAPGTSVPSGSLVTPSGSIGPTGPGGPATPSANTGNLITTGTDNLLYLPPSQLDPEIWSVRLRSFNAIGNPNFEVDQRNIHGALTNPANGTLFCDRWATDKGTATLGYSIASSPFAVWPTQNAIIPGTSYQISSYAARFTLTAQASLAAGDYLVLKQAVEGINFRELSQDVHSLSIFVRCSVSPITFAVALQSQDGTRSLVNLCTYSVAANNWQLITLPNLPIWSSGGNFTWSSGVVGYFIFVCLACGSTYLAPATGSWQNGRYYGASGITNFGAQALNSTFDLAFVQHEPGPFCTTLMDKPFVDNLRECKRYYQKSADYATLPPGSSDRAYGFPIGSNPVIYPAAPFEVAMAKAPTAVAYHNGTANQATVVGVGTVSVSACATDTTRIYQLTLGANNAATVYCASFAWTADTGW